jgi:hypothetical protein
VRVARPTGRCATQAQCTTGARTLVKPGDRVWPELGNGGYQSIHSDVFINYDAVTNKFLPGTHVELMQKPTQCLSEFSLDFDRRSSLLEHGRRAGLGHDDLLDHDRRRPATFVHRQPTFTGNPNGPDDPDPLAHAASNTNPVSATNPNPPACAPAGNNAAQQGVQCGETKLVITPAQPIPAGTNFKVVVNYVGQPGIRVNPSLGNEGWFKSNTDGHGRRCHLLRVPVLWHRRARKATNQAIMDMQEKITASRSSTTGANVISTAGDATLSVTDPSSTAPGHWSTARSASRWR